MTPNLIASGFRLLEGPVWDDRTESLIVADADGGGVYACKAGEVVTVVPHRKGIGGQILHEAGGLIVSGRNLAYKGPDNAPTEVLIQNDFAVSGLVGFSDIASDSKGRVYAGALGARPSREGKVSAGGGLFLLDLDGSTRAVVPVPTVKHTNGMGFSPSGEHLYYADSGYSAIFRYDVSESGDLANRQLFATLDQGMPDGVAIGSDGAVWVAQAFAGRILVYEPDGRLREHFDFPIPLVTNVCFGGPDLTDVYVTTGSLDPDERVGNIYRFDYPVPGHPVPRAKVPLQAASA